MRNLLLLLLLLTTLVRWAAPLTVSVFDQIGWYGNSPSNRAECYADLTVSSFPAVVAIASTHRACLKSDGQAELAQVT